MCVGMYKEAGKRTTIYNLSLEVIEKWNFNYGLFLVLT